MGSAQSGGGAGAGATDPSLSQMPMEIDELVKDFDRIIYNCDDELNELSLVHNSAGKESEQFRGCVAKYQSCIKSRDERLATVRSKCADSLDAFNKCSEAAGGDVTQCAASMTALVQWAQAVVGGKA